MTELSADYLTDRYPVLAVLADSARAKTEIVRYNGQLWVKKTLRGGQNTAVYDLIKALRHPGLAQIEEVFRPGAETVVIEQYIGGKTLEQLLAEQGPFAEETVIGWLRQLCRVLTVLHGHGFIHRDIKPSNVMLSADGVIKLIDFDCSRMYAGPRDSDTVLLGTKGYAPPEQCGYARTDPRSDIYSLGVLANVLCAGKMITEEVWRGGKLGPVIEKCTRLDPAGRYQSAAELLQQLSFLAQPSAIYPPPGNRKAKIVPPQKGRIRDTFSVKHFGRLAGLAILAVFLTAAALGSPKYAGWGKPLYLLSYYVIFLPPALYPADFLLLRSWPLLPSYRNPQNYKVYGANYFVLWILAIAAVMGAILILFPNA